MLMSVSPRVEIVGAESGSLCLQGKHLPTKLSPQPYTWFFHGIYFYLFCNLLELDLFLFLDVSTVYRSGISFCPIYL